MSRHTVERNLVITGEVAVVTLNASARRYLFHDGTEIRCVEEVSVGGERRVRGPTTPALDQREVWFRDCEYKTQRVRDLPEPVAAIIRDAV